MHRGARQSLHQECEWKRDSFVYFSPTGTVPHASKNEFLTFIVECLLMEGAAINRQQLWS